MKYISVVIIVVLLFGCKENKSNQKMDTEPVTKFWEITELLKEDIALNDTLWNSYFNLVGNKKYMENNRSNQNVIDHRRFLALVYRPSLSDSLTKTIESREFDNNDIFQNLLFLKDNENELRNYTEIITSPDYFQNCIELAKDYLPQDKYEVIPKGMKAYLQTFTYDAAVQNMDMYYGLSVVYDFDKFRKGAVIAHELHHVLRINKSLENTLSVRDSASYNMVDQVNNEGLADLIDKELVMINSEEILLGALFKNALLDQAESVIEKLDSCFVTNYNANGEFVNENDFREIALYLNGHVPGYYMANVIKRNGKLQELIDSSDNPFEIFYLYNDLARTDKKTPKLFSEKTIEYLKELERRAFD